MEEIQPESKASSKYLRSKSPSEGWEIGMNSMTVSLGFPGMMRRGAIDRIPLSKASKALVDSRVRPPPEVFFKIRHVRAGRLHVALLHGQICPDRLPSQGGLERRDEIRKPLRGVVSEVVKLIGSAGARGVGAPGIPRLIRAGDPVKDAENALHNVIDVRKIPKHVPFVVHVDGQAGEDRSGELEVRHIRSAPGTIDSKESQSRGGKAVEVAVCMRHQLICPLGCRIHAHRMIGAIVRGGG